jgi:hypothetical protein
LKIKRRNLHCVPFDWILNTFEKRERKLEQTMLQKSNLILKQSELRIRGKLCFVSREKKNYQFFLKKRGKHAKIKAVFVH